MIKRKLEIVVISDVHLGTNACHAKKLLNYLNCITPKKLILNGDIIDAWQFNKQYFPKQHLKIIKKIMDMAADGVEVIYITGNHDDILRKFTGTTIGNVSIVDKKVLDIDGKQAWFFHGDVFDISIKNAKWLTKLGSYGYNMLLWLNRLSNLVLEKLGKEKYSKSKKIKNSKSNSSKVIYTFEKVISNLAIENGYDYVICGHIHHPKMEIKETKKGQTLYMNSGDWMEHFTALEYQFKRWKLYHYNKDKLAPFFVDEDVSDLQIKDLIAAITIFKQTKQI
ncbi:UDP-2,3-diacylglucosamine diphosphatase [Confluentibacter citreus]|uniref:UDP-2,3-diacylglucosamine diphosphatase n=1 Tax=Confluentibacter citreus TaxID=2007307 RepID=UPI000C290327|nr:UDP-2,3-diacylglucosamine diphosphatase [Confluentibacter citreus]